MPFELQVARRYLRAKRKERFISIVTVISVVGVAAGVTALIVAMAINNGVQAALRDHLVGASSHINLLEKERAFGIEDYEPLIEKLAAVEHVEAAAPALYGEMMISTPLLARGCFLKGIDPAAERSVSGLLDKIVEGSADGLEPQAEGYPGILLGQRLADSIGARVSTVVSVLNPQGEITIFGRTPLYKRFQVAGVFETGFYEYDNLWAVSSLRSVQQSLSLGNVINSIEFKLDDLDLAEAVARKIERAAGDEFAATSWIDRNSVLFNALKTEKFVTTLIIGIIMLVAALNILTSLVMIVMEKNRDIAILKSMGASNGQIRKIFMWQGLTIGAAGTAIGAAAGHAVCWAAERYRLIPLEAEVYGLDYVPFAPRPLDGALVAAAAVLISYLVTIYPSSSAAGIAPAEALRYE